MTRKRFARPIREKTIEDACRLIANAHCARLVKTVVLGWPGFPDRMLLMPGSMCFIEFKRGDEQPTDLQQEWHRILRDSGQVVHVIRSVEGFKAIISC